METDEEEVASGDNGMLSFNELKADLGRAGLESVLKEINTLRTIRNLELPHDPFKEIPPSIIC